jgi:hypothetical protein
LAYLESVEKYFGFLSDIRLPEAILA